MPRRLTPERMDDPSVDRGDLDRSLRFIRGVNRRLGGARALWRHLRPLAARVDGPITLLDVATGSGDIPALVRGWGLEAGLDIRVTAIDLHTTTLDLARDHLAEQPEAVRSGIELIELDALEAGTRFGFDAFDAVHAGMFLHHLSDIRVMTALRVMQRCARRAVIWNDLHRSPAAWLGVRALTAGAPEIVRHDARVSVDAGFTKGEALELASRAGLESVRIRVAPLLGRFVLSSGATA
ncbi:MAG: methyltransferase domain-containing protein [Planctomycetota bacterium]